MTNWKEVGGHLLIVPCIAVLILGCGGATSNMNTGPLLDLGTFNFRINRVTVEDNIENGQERLTAQACCRLVVITITGAAPTAGRVSYRPEDFLVSFADDAGVMKTQSATGLGQHFVLAGGKAIDMWGFSHDPIAMANTNGTVSESTTVNLATKQGNVIELKLAYVLPKQLTHFQLSLPTVVIGQGDVRS